MENILVTGAAGFIGSHLSELLLQKGYKIVGLDNLSYGHLRNLSSILGHSKFELIQGNLRGLDLLLGIGTQIDVVLYK